MAELRILNRDPARVWLDARFSNTGIAFEKLPNVPGFPRWISQDEEFSIDMGNWEELLYRRSLRDEQSAESALYRIGMVGRTPGVRGSIFRLPFAPPERIVRSDDEHWFLNDMSEIRTHLLKTCEIESSAIHVVCAEILNGEDTTTMLLPSKIRTIQQYLIQPSIRIGQKNDDFVQVSVTITNQKSGVFGTRMIIEANPLEALSLIDSFTIKSGNLDAKPRTTKYGYAFAEGYRERGFRVPVSLPLTKFFPPS